MKMKKLVALIILVALILPVSAHAFDFSVITGFFDSLFGDDDCSPEIISVSIDPVKVEPGDIMTISAEITCARDVYALVSHEKGMDEVEMELIDDMWQGKWKEHDLKNEEWYKGFVMASYGDETARTSFSYQDPTKSHPASEITAGTFDSGNFIFPNNVNVTGRIYGEGSIPSGMIAMFNSSCPSGWTYVSSLEGKFPRGNSTYGGTGGNETHQHGSIGNHQHYGTSGQDPTNNYIAYTNRIWGYGSFSGTFTYHDHSTVTGTYTVSKTSSAGGHQHPAASNIPPYVDVVFCLKD